MKIPDFPTATRRHTMAALVFRYEERFNSEAVLIFNVWGGVGGGYSRLFLSLQLVRNTGMIPKTVTYGGVIPDK